MTSARLAAMARREKRFLFAFISISSKFYFRKSKASVNYESFMVRLSIRVYSVP